MQLPSRPRLLALAGLVLLLGVRRRNAAKYAGHTEHTEHPEHPEPAASAALAEHGEHAERGPSS